MKYVPVLLVFFALLTISCTKNVPGKTVVEDKCSLNKTGYECAVQMENSGNTASLEIFKSNCLSGDSKSCSHLENHIPLIMDSNSDRNKSISDFLLPLCIKNHDWSCKILMEPKFRITLSVNDLNSVFNYARSQCEKNNLQWCIILRKNIHAMARLKVPDFQRFVREIYTLACNRGDGLSCEYQGGFHEKIRKFPEALSDYIKGCDNGRYNSCLNAVRVIINRSPEHSSASYARIMEKICSRDIDEACVFLARGYAFGWWGEKNLEKSVSVLKKTCVRGDTNSCLTLGDFYRKGIIKSGDNIKKSLAIYKKSCFLGSEAGCARYSRETLHSDSGKSSGNDVRNILEKYCYYKNTYISRYNRYSRYRRPYHNNRYPNNGLSCGTLGILYLEKLLSPPSGEKGEKLALDSCNRGYVSICRWYIEKVQKLSVKISKTTLNKLEIQCDYGFSDGCRALYHFYLKGTSKIPSSKTKSDFFLKKLCFYDPSSDICKKK
ncbi:MAG: sel1 repeat family protein [Deltaproteobacteria bacterium]|nr:sel1 repeat family protein [Deltaproteobacteria bacterium]